MTTLLVALCLPIIAGCTGPSPSAITKIVVSITDCSHGCQFGQYAFYSNNRLKYSNGPSANDVDGPLDPQVFRIIADYASKLPAYGTRWDYLGSSPLPASYIWIEAGKSHWQVRFPTGVSLSGFGTLRAASSDPNVEAFTRFTELAVIDGNNAVAQARAPIIERLKHLERLTTLEFDSKGCYGTCPAYKVIFRHNGSATLTVFQHFKSTTLSSGTAQVPFARVIEMLQRARIASFRNMYPIYAVDTYGVAFNLQFDDGFNYHIEAPDSTTWPSEVSYLVGAVSQLVNDTPWH
jgi:hypothetical protein